MPRFVFAFLLLSGVSFADPPRDIGVLIGELRVDDAARRDSASQEILERWESWAEADLAALDAAALGKDVEASARARVAVGTIRSRRKLGVALAEKIEALDHGTGVERSDPASIIEDAAWLWKGGAVSTANLEELVRVAMERKLEFDDSHSAGLISTVRHYHVRPYADLILPILRDRKSDLRQDVLYALGQAGATQCAGEVAGLFKDEDPKVREGAATYFGQLKLRGHEAELLLLLKDADGKVRGDAANALGKMGALECADSVAVLLDDKAEYARRMAIDSLREMHALKYASRIARMLVDPEEDVKVGAFMALEEMRPIECAKTVFAILKSGDSKFAEAAGSLLGELKSPELADPLAELLANPNGRVRIGAIVALAGMRAERKLPNIAALLDDSDVDVRIAALRAIRRFRAVKFAPQVAALLKADETRIVKVALETLGRLLATEQADKILPLLDHPDPDVQEEAALTLGVLDVRDAIPRIVLLLKSGHADVRALACRALATLSARSAIESLRPLLEDDTWPKQEAAHALFLLGDPSGFDSFDRPEIRLDALGCRGLFRFQGSRGLDEAIRFLDASPLSVEFTLNELREFGFTCMSDAQKKEMARRLLNLEHFPEPNTSVAAEIGLLALGRKDVAAQLVLIERVAAEKDEFYRGLHGMWLSDALDSVYENEARTKAMVERKLGRVIGNYTDLQGLFKEYGFDLIGQQVSLPRRFDPDCTLSPHDIVVECLLRSDDFVEETGWVPVIRGNEICVMKVDDALALWRQRLAGK